uniref:1,6-beta-transglycosylase n=1 Tax=Chrysotila haptonemofera TaxID=35135 RepID=A0AA48LAU6_CHRHP|nr:1,6-beta-transglycosylase [Pleurochrysis haptonemofera]
MRTTGFVMRRTLLLGIAALAAAKSASHSSKGASASPDSTSDDKCCWCDPDTPPSAMTAIGSDSQVYQLVFSDEFNDPNRDFANGKDKKWTALDVGDTSNHGAAFFRPEQAVVMKDHNFSKISALRIRTENKSHTGISPEGEPIHMPYSSAMLQSWNKFCFTGGILEFRARLPRGAGYWPALWAFGNLGRAVYQNSNTGLWPWSYDECDADLVLPPTDPPQRISACMDFDLEKDGLHAFQGRGATELDVLEGAVTNSGLDSYAVGSLQLSPGIPPYFRPPMFGFPTAEGPGSWYAGLKLGEKGKLNNGWYGPPYGSECLTGCPDALSGGLTELSDLDTRYWTFRMEWTLGPDGGLTWKYDDALVWSMPASSFGEYSVCSHKPGEKDNCWRTPPRKMPQEPMSLVMNTAIGTWNGGVSAVDGQHWPADFYVDYVRVWQSEVNIGCDPPDYPTAAYIDKHSFLYGEPVAPLGKDTCPEIYPPSAYANAEFIKGRALERRAAAAAAKAKAAEAAKSKEADDAASGAGPAAFLKTSTHASATEPAYTAGSLVAVGAAGATVVIAAAFAIIKATQGRRTWRNLPHEAESMAGEYQLAQ